ncbi:MBL fold metallo-hydrolase [Liquorilactobacillus hordei]|uniref:MBL fold metallo-hydrolase n=1 Tax=Liquorilactobacillus hordei TaxID=468911 RepID=UPI0039E96AEC
MKNEISTFPSLKLRWINAQCFEFKLPNGITLLTDPFFDMPFFEKNKGHSVMGFTADDIEGADYIFINHTHGDHIANLKQVYDRFNSKIICHSSVALEVAKSFEVSLTSIYPVDFSGHYIFPGFTLDIFHGTHHPIDFSYKKMKHDKFIDTGSKVENDLNILGSIFNLNFLMTLSNGLRIAFVGGNDDGMNERLKQIKPNILIRNKMGSSRDFDNVSRKFADNFIDSGAQLLIPMHVEQWANEKVNFLNSEINDINKIAENNNVSGRAVLLKRKQWYNLGIFIS